MRPEQIPYGVKDFKRVRLEKRYFVDKSQYIDYIRDYDEFLKSIGKIGIVECKT